MKEFEYDPAFDADLGPRQRANSVRREAGLISTSCNTAWRLACVSYMRTVHRLSITGQEQLPAARPFVLIANHCSHLDTLAICAALPKRLRRDLYPLAAADTFFDTPASSAVASNLINALPVQRGKAMAHAIADLRERISKPSGIYLLFPEGTRSEDGTLARFKPGLGMLVAETPVPIVPCHIAGAFAAWPRQDKLPRPHRISVTIGTPISFEQTPNNRAGWCEIAAMTQQAIASLAEPMTVDQTTPR